MSIRSLDIFNYSNCDSSSDDFESPLKKNRYDIEKDCDFKMNHLSQDIIHPKASQEIINHREILSDRKIQGYSSESDSESILEKHTEYNKKIHSSNRSEVNLKLMSKSDAVNSTEQKVVDFSGWSEALDDALDGKCDRLLELIRAGLLNELDPEVIEEIYDCGLAEDNREIILECLKAGHVLSPSERDNVLILALNNDYDIELIKTILKIKDKEWKNDPFVIAFHKATGVDSETIEVLLSNAIINEPVLKECEWRACLANMWGIHGAFKFNNRKIEYQGAFVHFFIDKILSSIQALQFEFPGKVDEDLLKMLYNLIDGSGITIIEKICAFKNNQPIMIHGGVKDHFIEVVLWKSQEWSAVENSYKSYLLINNKGFLSEVPVKVYSIDPSTVNAEIIKEIKEGAMQFTDEEAEIFYSTSLPNYLKGSFHQALTNALTNKWIDKSLEQVAENCSWESIRAAMFGVAGVDAWTKNQCEDAVNSTIQEESISEAFQKVLQWDIYVGLWALGEYLNNSVKDPSKLDFGLVESILKEAKTRIGTKRVESRQYEQMLNKYQQFKSQTGLIPSEQKALKGWKAHYTS